MTRMLEEKLDKGIWKTKIRKKEEGDRKRRMSK